MNPSFRGKRVHANKSKAQRPINVNLEKFINFFAVILSDDTLNIFTYCGYKK